MHKIGHKRDRAWDTSVDFMLRNHKGQKGRR